MPKRMTEEEWECRLQAEDGLPDKSLLNGKQVFKKLEPGSSSVKVALRSGRQPRVIWLNDQIDNFNRKIRAIRYSEEECQKPEGERHSCFLQEQELEAQELDDYQNWVANEYINQASSPKGRPMIDAMAALYRKGSAVSDHPALKAGNGCCPTAGCALDVKATLKTQHSVLDLCPICHRWYIDMGEFEVHCQHHIYHPATISLEYGFLEVCGTLAWSRFCPQCLSDKSKKARRRMAAFYDQQSLTRHMNRHYNDSTLVLGCGSFMVVICFSTQSESFSVIMMIYTAYLLLKYGAVENWHWRVKCLILHKLWRMTEPSWKFMSTLPRALSAMELILTMTERWSAQEDSERANWCCGTSGCGDRPCWHGSLLRSENILFSPFGPRSCPGFLPILVALIRPILVL
ncbi:hypothetical protein PAAG_00830 [Paracoccidioides lutzii Pb01]|uniref:Uncharacterized protein n=1 Tax=Paracoccidioides lutzii (strain ATCC MYA-826 / Pb01) TaxID=502779 RepID=C1GQN5_PARBA|nr:hypothetical protein PAAG_00830 [Paracoccidioides lutzii Pb01]EEH37909.2 hypothetical protein PAAG_00830 [Paracoccidioides lutzii Pb01]